MATHSSILAWKTPWTEKAVGLQSMMLQRIRHDLPTKQQQSFFFLPNLMSWSLYTLLLKTLQTYIISNDKQCETACMYYLVILLWNRLDTDWSYGLFFSLFLYHPFLPPCLSFFLYIFFLQLLKGQVPSWNSWPLHCHLLCLKDSCPGL